MERTEIPLAYESEAVPISESIMATEIRQNCFFDADCLADEICIENNCVDKKTWFLEQVGYYYDQAKIEGGWQTILKEVVKLLKRIF